MSDGYLHIHVEPIEPESCCYCDRKVRATHHVQVLGWHGAYAHGGKGWACCAKHAEEVAASLRESVKERGGRPSRPPTGGAR